MQSSNAAGKMFSNNLWILIFFLPVFARRESGKEDENFESKLYNELVFKRHADRFSRPVRHHGEVVLVQFSLRIYDVMSISDNSDVLTLNGFLLMKWKDSNFTWDPKLYDNLHHINIPDYYLWKPDVVLINSMQQKDDSSYRSRSYIRIQSSGHLEWDPPVTLSIRCPMDLRAFPFDEHFCKLKFASLNYLAEHLNITLGKTQFLQDVDTGEWIFKSWSANAIYEKKELPYIEYEIHLRRRAPYYAYAILLPILVILFASLAVFWLPPDAGEKITLSGFICLLLLLLLIQLYWIVPRSGSSVPGIVILCSNALAFVGVSLVISVVTISLSRSPHLTLTPEFIRNLLSGWLGKFLCLGPQTQQNGHTILDNSQENTLDIDHSNDDRKEINDWNLLALAIDRICFVIYLVSFVILSIVCLT